MIIKENIQLINELLNNSYGNLQQLAYEEEIERYVRIRLLDITQVAKDILEFKTLTEDIIGEGIINKIYIVNIKLIIANFI